MTGIPHVVNTEGPINDLFYAINHYISTGDYIGAGTAAETEDGGPAVVIPVNRSNRDDVSDSKRFQRRMSEITDANGLPAAVTYQKDRGEFDYLLLQLPVAEARSLAKELVRSCGGAGWGSCKADIDTYRLGLREKILSGEGV